MDDLKLRAGVEFANHGVGQQLLDAKGLAMADEAGNRDGADSLRQSIGMADGVIAAAGQASAAATRMTTSAATCFGPGIEGLGESHLNELGLIESGLIESGPAGGKRSWLSAHSTAFSAETRRLSMVAQSQTPFL